MVLALLLVFLVANGFLLQVVAVVRNMALQHHKFELRLRDVKRLRLYVQAGMAEREMQSTSLKEAELACHRLELEARESTERAAPVEAERDAECHEEAMAKLVTEGAINTQAQIESELAWVQHALALAEEAHRRAESEHGAAREALDAAGEACKKEEEENGRLVDERLALVIELGTVNDEFATFREKAAADRETMEAKFDSNGDALFNYGYGCFVFTHNICESKPQILDGIPDPSIQLTPEFFSNPCCPPSISSAAPTLDPAVGIEEKHLETSLIASGEEANLPIGPPASPSGGIENTIAD